MDAFEKVLHIVILFLATKYCVLQGNLFKKPNCKESFWVMLLCWRHHRKHVVEGNRVVAWEATILLLQYDLQPVRR